ncbi:CIA30 family protein [Lysobacter sp. A3-1-A15]|uniref:CIA30 family protein n=1 Tax=Novilysobacter viscosus TaxID=3098602 RepID=UPI002EDA3190
MSPTRLPFLPTIALLCGLAMPAAAAPREPDVRTLVNFDGDPDEPRWVAVNDGVMGGQSSGGPALGDGVLEFSGTLSLANNGGFSSVRSVGRGFDLGDASHVLLRVRGDGRRYRLRLATDARHRGMPVSYGAGFDTSAGEWTRVRLPLSTLAPTVRGRALQGPPLDPSRVREIGLLIADKREGPFRLVVDWIAAE